MKGVVNTLFTGDMAKGFLTGIEAITGGLDTGLKAISDFSTEAITKGFGDAVGDRMYDLFEKINLGEGIQSLLTKATGGLGDFFSGTLGKVFEGSSFTGKIGEMFNGISSAITKSDFGNKLNSTLSGVFETAFDILGHVGGNPLTNALKETIGGWFEDKQLENDIETKRQSIAATESEIASLKQQQSAMDDIGKVYDTLSKKRNLSAQEQQQLADVTNQLAQAMPEMVLG